MTLRQSFAALSIEWKFPLVLGALLAVLIGTLSISAYVEIRRVDIALASERLHGLAQDFARLLDEQSRAAVGDVFADAAHDALRNHLTRGDAAPAARAALVEARGQQRTGIVIQLLNRAGNVVLAEPGGTELTLDDDDRELLTAGRGGVGRFRVRSDRMVYPVVAPVRGDTDAIGYLVVWRRLTMSEREREANRRLIGAELIVGSPGPDAAWTDLARIVPAPPVDVTRPTNGTVSRFTSADRRLVAVATLPSAPWVVVASEARENALVAAHRFRPTLVVTGLLVFLVGVVASRIISLRMSQPIRELTGVAEALSSGQYATRVDVRRADEFGTLGKAFNNMAARIEETIAELQRTQQQFIQAQRLEAVARLAGGVAHDFNNILTVILGEAELALESLSEHDPQRKPFQEIVTAGGRAAGLTRQLLAFSRRQIIEPTVFDLNTVLTSVQTMLRRLIGEDVQITMRTTPDRLTVHADVGQIEQVIVNLAVNARDAMPVGGQLILETSVITLDAAYAESRTDVVPGDYAMLTVSDTGVGMSPEVLARAFEPFYTTKDSGKGTGLGLATCYGIVKQSGGHISVYSELGVGTTVRVYLPRVHAAVTTPARELPSVMRGHETVLLVEDDAGVRQVAAKILQKQGYRVIEAASADEALRLVAGHEGPIDLLLTDVVLPHVSGRKLAEEIVALRPTIKVLYMSGYTGDVIMQHQLIEGHVALIQKPFTAQSLGRKVREVVEG